MLHLAVSADVWHWVPAAHKLAWGDQAPYLPTMILHHHPLQTPMQRQASSSRQRQQPTGPSSKEVCLQYNRGSCSYGSQCVFDHMCASCRKNCPSHDHIAATPSSNSSAQTSTQQTVHPGVGPTHCYNSPFHPWDPHHCECLGTRASTSASTCC